MRHCIVLGLALIFIGCSVRSMTGQAYVACSSRRHYEQHRDHGFHMQGKKVVNKVVRVARSAEDREGKSGSSVNVGMVLGLGLLGAVAPIAQAAEIDKNGGHMKLVSESATRHVPKIAQYFGKDGSKSPNSLEKAGKPAKDVKAIKNTIGRYNVDKDIFGGSAKKGGKHESAGFDAGAFLADAY